MLQHAVHDAVGRAARGQQPAQHGAEGDHNADIAQHAARAMLEGGGELLDRQAGDGGEDAGAQHDGEKGRDPPPGDQQHDRAQRDGGGDEKKRVAAVPGRCHGYLSTSPDGGSRRAKTVSKQGSHVTARETIRMRGKSYAGAGATPAPACRPYSAAGL